MKTSDIKPALAVASWVVAIVFAAVGLCIPPEGEVHGSVLILIAQLLVLSATFLGIKDFKLPQK